MFTVLPLTCDICDGTLLFESCADDEHASIVAVTCPTCGPVDSGYGCAECIEAAVGIALGPTVGRSPLRPAA